MRVWAVHRQNPSAPYADSTQASNHDRDLRAGGVVPPSDECGSMGLWCLMVRQRRPARSRQTPQPVLPSLPPLPALPQRLAAERPGWIREVDIVVIGSGIAGLTAALECRDLGTIMVVTKDEVSAGSTHWAQGGIAWVQAEGDTIEQHIDDTLVAGAGLCIEDAVRVLVTEGPDEVAKLINRGAEFDRDLAGRAGADSRGRPHAAIGSRMREVTPPVPRSNAR